MVEALRRVGGEAAVQRIHWQPDAEIQRIVGGWPGVFTSARALQLGFRADASMEEIVQAFVEDDFVPALQPSSPPLT
jgi:hypothetical protein